MLRSTYQATIGLILLFISIPLTLAQTTMTYQGQLQDGSSLVDGESVELYFELYDDPDPGNGTLISDDGPFNVSVEDGLFQVELDFGDVNYTVAKYLRIRVDGTWLDGTQEITTVPVATRALNVLPGVSGIWSQSGDAISYSANGQGVIFSPDGSSDQGPIIAIGHGSNDASARGVTVSGGGQSGAPNVAGGAYAVIAGGFGNIADGQRAVVSGGADNEALGFSATIGGGRFNVANSVSTTIAGGLSNEATGSNSVIGGGWRNKTGDSLSVVPGGQENEARARYSFAGGYNAIVQADHRGAFVWADDVNQLDGIASDRGEPFQSQAANEFAVRATGGVRFVTDIDDNGDALQSLHFNSQGQMGINRSSPLAALHVESASGEDAFRSRIDGLTGLRVHDNRGVSVGTAGTPPAAGLSVSGELELNTLGSGGSQLCINSSDIVSECNTSSRRFKQNIQSFDGAKERIERLRAVRFNWIETGETDIGLIAEEVAEVAPELALYEDDGQVRGVKYRQLGVVLLAAMQEQHREMAAWQREQQDRLAAMEAENARLRSAVERNAELAERNRDLEGRLAALEAVLLEKERVARSE
ncbi:tail fiber domain-containing protein [Wenzhouxiangella sp. EGI_FJ10305]|uniref:tail fiber domain-containing protein n=1 Tax=Wenzhouxiangella sp. EGI_FJ10305 TaxID=3243768 RepID=UPI0035D6FDBA